MAAWDLLDQELWAHIFELCRDQPLNEREDGFVPQPTLAALMRVSSATNRIAGPILYRSVSCIDFNSFFLGCLPPSLPQPTSGSHIKSKNSLLQYTRRLHALNGLPCSETSDVRRKPAQDARVSIAHGSLAAFLRYLLEPVPTLLGRAHDLDYKSLEDLPAYDAMLFPLLSHVKLQPRAILDDDDYDEGIVPLDPLAAALIQLGRPKHWCGQNPPVIPRQPSTYTQRFHHSRLESVSCHVSRHSIKLVPGINNTIFAHQSTADLDRDVGFINWEMAEFDVLDFTISGLKSALEEKIMGGDLLEEGSDEEDEDAASRAKAQERRVERERIQAVARGTSVTVYGIIPVRPLGKPLQANMLRELFGMEELDVSEEAGEVNRDELEDEARAKAVQKTAEAQKRIRAWMVSQRTQGGCPLDPERVVLKMPWEGKCEVCGRSCKPP